MSFESAVLGAPESDCPEAGAGAPESDVAELELSEEPPPQPTSKNAATTSARIAPALVVFAGLARRR